jgi:nucleotide-binding universal stress UspA family protein
MMLVDSKSMVRLRNILCATDFSSSSDAALSYAAAIARRYDSQLHLAHVIRPEAYEAVPPMAITAALEQTRLYAEKQMSEVLISGRLRGIPHQVLIGEGDFWPVLSGMIRNNEVDLIVAGTHGRTGVRKLLLGSVAEEMFRLAKCPVLTVGPHVPRDVAAEVGFRNILFATDFSPNSGTAAAYALSLAQEHCARLTLLHAVEEASKSSQANTTMLRSHFTQLLKEFVPPEAGQWCDPEYVVEFGEAADTILKVAADRRADLIVMGVRKSATFPGHLPPSTSYRVVCVAHSPVLTIRALCSIPRQFSISSSSPGELRLPNPLVSSCTMKPVNECQNRLRPEAIDNLCGLDETTLGVHPATDLETGPRESILVND